MSIQPWLKTGRLGEMAVLVASDSICLVLDLVTVRVNAFFTRGNLGALQQLLYHPNSREHKPGSPWAGKDIPEGRWSIRPLLNTPGESSSVPVFPIGRPQSVALDEKRAICKVSGIPMTGGTPVDFTVAVEANRVRFTVDSRGAGIAGLESNFFPLYTTAVVEGRKYDISGSEPTTLTAQSMLLEDADGSMPSMEASLHDGRIEMSATREWRKGYLLDSDDPPQVCLPGLHMTTLSDGSTLELSLTLRPPVSGRKGNKAAKAVIPSEIEAATTMGDTLLAIRERCGAVLPDLAGLIPSAVNFADLSPHEFPSTDYVVSTYVPRAIMSLTAASRATGDPRYGNAGAEVMKNYLDRCPRAPGGDAIIVVGGFLKTGEIKDPVYSDDGELTNCFYHRPSNFAIVIRALLALRALLLCEGSEQDASELLELSVRVMAGLQHSFGLNWKYVNNPHYTLAQLVLAMESVRHPQAAWARGYLLEDLAQRPYGLFAGEAVSICRSGAGESCPNTEQDYASTASEALAVWLLTGEKQAAEAARAIAQVMTLNQRFFADAPELHGASIVESLEHYDGGYQHAAYHGGMWDLVRMEMLLATAEHCKDAFSQEAARLLYKSRMTWSYRADGTVLGGLQHVPGLTYRNATWSEIHNYGAFGLYLEAFFKA